MSLNKMFKVLDKVDRPGQEEFIWAMRTRAFDLGVDNEVTHEKRLKTFSIFGERKDSERSSVHNLVKENPIKLLTSYLPDELVIDPLNYNIRLYEVAYVRGFISGIDDLINHYRTEGKGAQFNVANIVNSFMTSVAQDVFFFNGDIIQYGGDFFDCIWKQGKISINDCVHLAMDFALRCKKTFSPEVNSAIKLDLSIGIACGTILFSAIGNEQASSFMVLGKPLEEISTLSAKVVTHKAIITNTVFEHLNVNEYICSELPSDFNTYIVSDYSSAWRSIHLGKNARTRPKTSNHDSASFSDIMALRELSDIYESRPPVGDAINMNMFKEYRRFVCPVLVHAIDSGESVDNLIELRHMSLMAALFTLDVSSYTEVVKLADSFYRMINRIIEPYGGYIFKVYYSDNAVIYLILFGIRGRANGLESRDALLAAYKCFKSTENTSFVNYCAIAVVTGSIFCGSIGHYLRRDYCIVGNVINVAKLLIREFSNKVICDRDTFLKSQLEVRHFTMQEFKHVSDFLKLGPIYEYVEFDTSNRLPKFKTNKYPLLDRDYELQCFRDLVSDNYSDTTVNKFRQLYEPSGLFFLGEPRQGKTRLINELVLLTPPTMLMFRLRLCAMDKSIPYQTVFFIFGVPLGFDDSTTSSERELKLLQKLKHLQLNGFECALNIIFRVNFKKTDAFNALTETERFKIQQNLVKHLALVCFSKPWVVFIDGGEYIDNESWDIIYPILETHCVLVVAAIGCSKETLPPNARDYICRTKSRYINLLPISKLYHAAVACQMLECVAIPIELEKVLQDKSHGNPGWIESFLLSLVNSDIIWIRKSAGLTDFTDQLVLPKKEYLFRLSDEMEEDNFPICATISTLQRALDLNEDKWKIFSSIEKTGTEYTEIEEILRQRQIPEQAKESGGSSGNSRKSVRLSMRASTKYLTSPIETALPEKTQSVNIEVCVLFPGSLAALHAFDADVIDIHYITKTLDSLSSYELHLLKCASVIGDFFLRDMLTFLVNKAGDRDLALGCQHLFELGIFACAEGDFRKTLMNYAPLMSDHYKSYDETTIQCNCIGYLVSDSCRDLPHYANCGYMRFKDFKIYSAVYKLITQGQLINLHARAQRYLENKTRKCVSCGGGVFTRILGNHYEEGMLAERRKGFVRVGGPADKSSASLLEDWEHLGQRSTMHSLSKLSRFRAVKSDESRLNSASIFYKFRKSDISIPDKDVPSFEHYDFTCCQCDQILSCMYYAIRRHCEVTEEYEKWMHATLEYCVMCIKEFNIALALKYLQNALEILKGPYKKIIKPGESWKHYVMKGRILTELGRAHSAVGQTKLAYLSFEEAFKCFGFRIPRPFSLRYKILELKQHFTLTLKSRRGIGAKYGYVAEFCDNVSYCLSLMSDFFLSLNMWDHAYIAAVWCIRKALQSEKNFIILTNALNKIIFISGRMKKYSICDAYEIMALDYCRRYRCSVDINDLRAVASLYSSIFQIRVQRAIFDGALNIGFSLDRLTDMMHMRKLLVQLFPLFFEILLIRMEGYNLMNALRTFEQVTVEYGAYIGDVWFLALSVYFHLQTGYIYVRVKECEQYYYTQCKGISTFNEPDAERRYFVAIWLWYIRTENYDLADIWGRRLPSVWKVQEYESINNLITTLMYIEGLIMLLAFRMDRKVIFVIEEMYKQISDLLSKVERHAETVKIIGPRVHHLKAYFYMCKNNVYKGWEILEYALKLAKDTDNSYDTNWAEHSKRAWERNMPAVEYSCWKDHADYDVMDYKEMESDNYKITFFTLELPIYL